MKGGVLLLIIFFSCSVFGQEKIILTDGLTGQSYTYKKVTLSSGQQADGVIYVNKNGTIYKRMYDGKINVKWFGAKGDGITDDSKAIQKAFEIGESIFFPAGNYRFASNVNKRFEIEGDAGNTVFSPVDNNKSILNFQTKAPYFTYASIVSNIWFTSKNKIGTAISFGKNDVKNKSIEDEYAGNVVFRNLRFIGFQKAVYFPFGNIGCNFFSCACQANEYGIYSLDNRWGGDIMHAGNKYFYACEFDSNNVAVYFNNTTEGFGGVSFNNCIFEANAINGYFYSNNTYTPIIFQNCWDEKGNIPKQVVLDSYDGSILKKISIEPASYIFDGSRSDYLFIGGRVMNLKVLGSNINVNSYHSKFEYSKAVSADKTVVSDNSKLTLFFPSTDQGIQSAMNIDVKGIPFLNSLEVDANNSGSRFFPISSFGFKSNFPEFYSVNFGNPITLSGSFNASAPDFQKINSQTARRLNLDFSDKNQYLAINETKTTFFPGYYFIAITAKVNRGNPIFFVWDRNENQFVNFQPVNDQEVHSYGAYGYVAKKTEFFLDISSYDGKSVTLDILDYKIYNFSRKQELQSFLLNNL